MRKYCKFVLIFTIIFGYNGSKFIKIDHDSTKQQTVYTGPFL